MQTVLENAPLDILTFQYEIRLLGMEHIGKFHKGDIIGLCGNVILLTEDPIYDKEKDRLILKYDPIAKESELKTISGDEDESGSVAQ